MCGKTNRELSVPVNCVKKKSGSAISNCQICMKKKIREISEVMHVALTASASEQSRSRVSVASARSGRGGFVV